MIKRLKKIYLKFLRYYELVFIDHAKNQPGVDQLRASDRKIKKAFRDYYRISFLDFLTQVKNILFSTYIHQPMFFEVIDQFSFLVIILFLRKEKIISVNSEGRIKVLERWLLNIFPKRRTEEEIKEIIQKKFKTKLDLSQPSNLLFNTKVNAEQYDQFPISVSSAIFEVKKILDYIPLKKKFLFVGDDDFVSLYLSCVDPEIESLVIDADKNLLERIHSVSEKFRFKIKTKIIDISKDSNLGENFIGFLCSPVYTFEGVKKFVQFGKKQFGPEGGYAFLNYGDESIGNRQLFLQEFFSKNNLQIKEVITQKIFYPWQLLHQSDRVLIEEWKKFLKPEVIKKIPYITSSFWVLNYIPFKVPKPKKQFFYAYL